jgi:hypothetical protein
MITYNGIIEYFKEVANKHTQINSFSFGDIDDADLEKIEEYPLLHVGVTGANIDERVISYDINIMLIEIVDDKDDRKENERYALSNTLQILQDLQTEFLKGSSIVTPDTKLTGNALACSPITGNYNNRVVGWSTLMTIEGANESTACNIPYLPILSWDYQTPTPPIATLVSNGYAWFSATEKQESNIDYGGNEYITTWQPIFDDISFGNLGATIGGSGSSRELDYDFKNKAILISGIDPVNFATSFVLLSANDTFFMKVDQITGGSNTIFSLVSSTEEVDVRITNGSILLSTEGELPVPLSPDGAITGLQTDNPKLTDNDAIVRDTPYTFAVKIVADKEVHLYYGGSNRAEMTTPANITGAGVISIGNRSVVSTIRTNFRLKEFIYTNGTMSTTEIQNTIEWLNAK